MNVGRRGDTLVTIDRGGLRRRRGGGFTLIEVMISVAMVLLLIYGVTQVFKMSSDTVGANQAVATMVRDQRAAIATMKDDFRNCVNDSPMFVIASRVAYEGPAPFPDTMPNGQSAKRGFRAGFRDAQDELQSVNANKDPTFYWDTQSNSEKQFGISPLNDHLPRVDRLGFFARNLYQRQTAPNDRVYSSVTSTDAYIWYGPVALVTTTTSNPAAFTLPQNQYAKDRILGRMAILLKVLPSASTVTNPNDPTSDTEQSLLITGQPDDLSPLDVVSSKSGQVPHPFVKRAYDCMSDLADTTIDEWRAKADTVFAKSPSPPGSFYGPMKWYQPMVEYPLDSANQWWARCRPTLVRPITSQRLSQTASSFIPHCTHFIVEYAGDFLDQAPDGTILDAKYKQDPAPAKAYDPPASDSEANRTADGGAIDFVVDKNGSADPRNWVRRIRWYGLPRDTDGDGRITINDVLPLADVMATGPAGVNGMYAPWEKELPAAVPNYVNFPTSNAKNFRYVCAWHNGAPPLIRITMKLDDPTGRLQGGQWYEFVLSR